LYIIINNNNNNYVILLVPNLQCQMPSTADKADKAETTWK